MSPVSSEVNGWEFLAFLQSVAWGGLSELCCTKRNFAGPVVTTRNPVIVALVYMAQSA